MRRYTLFRDDDVSVTTDIGLLMRAHDLIVSHGKTHAVGVLMERLWDAKEVWLWLMTTPGLIVGLHGWRHEDYSTWPTTSIVTDIQRSLDYWRERSGAYPEAPQITTFFPPWNRVSPALEQACRVTGLTLDARWKKGGVFGFHSWELVLPEREGKLARALRT